MRQALLVITTIGLVMSLAWAGSLAYFSDTETSEGNTLQAGTLDMTMSEVTWGFPFEDMKPGDSTGVQVINLEMADGSNPADHIEIDVDTHDFVDWTGESGGTNSADDFKKQIRVDKLDYLNNTTENLLMYVDDSADGNLGFISLYDVEAHGIFDDLLTFGLGMGGFKIELSLPWDLPDADDDKYQGDSIQIDFEFGAAQVAGQDVLTD